MGQGILRNRTLGYGILGCDRHRLCSGTPRIPSLGEGSPRNRSFGGGNLRISNLGQGILRNRTLGYGIIACDMHRLRSGTPRIPSFGLRNPKES